MSVGDGTSGTLSRRATRTAESRDIARASTVESTGATIAVAAGAAADGVVAAAVAGTGIVAVTLTGPAVGAVVPTFKAPDQNGSPHDLQSLMGPKGAILVFYRSADW